MSFSYIHIHVHVHVYTVNVCILGKRVCMSLMTVHSRIHVQYDCGPCSYRSLSSRPHSELSKQIYVEHLSVSDTELRISVRTASQLPTDLGRIKSRLGFPLVKFEAPIHLEALTVNHMLGTSSMYLDTFVKHYTTVSVLGVVN